MPAFLVGPTSGCSDLINGESSSTCGTNRLLSAGEGGNEAPVVVRAPETGVTDADLLERDEMGERGCWDITSNIGDLMSISS